MKSWIIVKTSLKLLSSVADPDPGSGAFLTLDPGYRKFFLIPDLGSRIPNPIFFIACDIFWVKSTVILSVLAKKITFTCSKIKLFTIYDICGYKKNFSPHLLVLLLDPGFGIRDPQHCLSE